jgi:uncharacterized Ntn-hydrolase superfamily protein
MTFSIAARCAVTGMFGIAVSSSSPAVAGRCAHARAGVGAVATQNITDPALGVAGLDLMATGLSAPQALARLRAESPHMDYRQLALVDRQGRTATYSGDKTLGLHASEQQANAVAAGNLLRSRRVPRRMLEAFFLDFEDPLGDRIIAAMKAALEAGGEEGPVHSAGMLLVRDVAWPIADLRIDWHETDPIGALAELWSRWKPQMDAYVLRARDPASAPSYGVPGNI